MAWKRLSSVMWTSSPSAICWFGMLVAHEIKQEIKLDLDVLRDCRFLDLEPGVVMASQLDRAVVNVNADLFPWCSGCM